MLFGLKFSLDGLPSLQNTDSYFDKLMQPEGAKRRILGQVLLLVLFLLIYGFVMGAYHSFLQAVVAGAKLSLLFVLALLICFPAFFIVQFILGSRLKLFQMVSMVLSGFLLMSAIMISFVPIVVIFLLTGSNYYFLHLLHLAIMFFAGIFGMNTIVQALKYSCEKKGIYPKNGVVVFRVWVVILAFVGIQLAWSLRPFISKRGEPFEFFGEYEGNFYAAVIYAAKQLAEPEEKSPAPEALERIESLFPPDTLRTTGGQIDSQ